VDPECNWGISAENRARISGTSNVLSVENITYSDTHDPATTRQAVEFPVTPEMLIATTE
jgi:hypothetical protein